VRTPLKTRPKWRRTRRRQPSIEIVAQLPLVTPTRSDLLHRLSTIVHLSGGKNKTPNILASTQAVAQPRANSVLASSEMKMTPDDAEISVSPVSS
jgi:hypothetical protein